MSVEPTVGEDELHAFVDGRLTPERRDAVATWLAGEPAAAARVQAWRDGRDALRRAFGAPPPGAGPDLMRILDARAANRRARAGTFGAVAASVLALGIGGAAGWTLRGLSPSRGSAALAALEQEAFATHAVYAADRRHPIEVNASEREHLSQWLSNRLSRNVAPPDLTGAGWRLLGGRLLATERGGAAALLMYDNPQGQRLSLVLRPMAPELAVPEPRPVGGAVNASAWITGGLGYAVVSAAPPSEVAEVARLVRQQSHA